MSTLSMNLVKQFSVSSTSVLTTAAALTFGVAASSAALLDSPVVPARHTSERLATPWPAVSEVAAISDFLAHALPVAGNKADLSNEALSFFRVPEFSTNDSGVILYVGLRPEVAPTGNQYRAPLFSGSIHSFRLGAAESRPAPQTVGDIGEIHDEDAPATPMAYIVYRLDFGTRNEDVSLFATPLLTSEPVTMTTTPDAIVAINADFAWERIRFIMMPSLDERDVDWYTERTHAGRLVPEPTAIALLFAGVLGFAARRRRA